MRIATAEEIVAFELLAIELELARADSIRSHAHDRGTDHHDPLHDMTAPPLEGATVNASLSRRTPR